MLECKGINTFYGPAHILFDLSIQVSEGQMVCLLGRNGVGKSTTLKSIMGLAPVASGSINFDGVDITGWPAFKIARSGLGYVPEERRIFAELSVEDNLEVAERGGSPWSRQAVYDLFPPLLEFRHRNGGHLSGGQQQMLTIARTLVGNPRLLLIDEPTEGLSPIVVRSLEDMIRDLKAKGQTMLLAAQDVKFSLSVADYIYVMDRGRIVYEAERSKAQEQAAEIRRLMSV
ncbi:ABC transporter ATP-binding protein [Ferrovibrio sp.]|uniref:ABC transporter ATP-binding protein n=1 Tax=Ferrovibrio sp. TaxID=1917215 RepID=UPI0035B043F4